MQKIIYCLVLLAGVVTRANSTPADERAQALLLQMSLEEKITMYGNAFWNAFSPFNLSYFDIFY